MLRPHAGKISDPTTPTGYTPELPPLPINFTLEEKSVFLPSDPTTVVHKETV